MTLRAIMDHLHLGIAHVRHCSAHCFDHALQCLQKHQHDVLLRHDPRVPFEKPDREGHKHPSFGTLASQTLGAAALAERPLRQVTKSRAETSYPRALSTRPSRETFGEFQGTTCARCRSSRKTRSCAAPCPATEIDAALQSPQSGAKSTPVQDVPPSAAAGRTRRRCLEDPSNAHACHVSSGLMQGCWRRELVHGALDSACATQNVQPHLRVGLQLHSAA